MGVLYHPFRSQLGQNIHPKTLAPFSPEPTPKMLDVPSPACNKRNDMLYFIFLVLVVVSIPLRLLRNICVSCTLTALVTNKTGNALIVYFLFIFSTIQPSLKHTKLCPFFFNHPTIIKTH
jgi:hypothetical protein